MRRILIMVAAVAMLVVMAVPASAAGPDFVVELTGAEVVPAGSGDPQAFGIARLDFSRADLEACVVFDGFRIRGLTGGHIHEGDAGTNGPIVIDFPGPESCVDVEREVLREILRNPAGFYLDVHTVEYPNGAIRGQLA